MKILELGSGPGEVMAQLCSLGHEVEAIDEKPGFFGGRKMNIYGIDKYFKDKFEIVLLQMPLGLDMKTVVEKVLSILDKNGVFYVITEKDEVLADLNQYWKTGKIKYGIRDDIPLSSLAKIIETTNVACKLRGAQCFVS